MGAYKTSAAVVSYQLVKDKATRETNPVIQILGVGYDRTLGGLEMQLRLRDYLAEEFNALKKTPTDVFTNNRAMAKLFKEAGRVKNVLSANANHYAQIEGLIDEKDFKFQVTREKFEELCKDLFERVAAPLNKALTTAGLSLEHINQVILFGGGTRVPKIQEVLRAAINQDLGKNINMDEAAAMGAVYRAADLATGFKVKKIVTKDATVFPIQVTFEREGDSGSVKLVKRVLFGPMNPYPQKKVITFNKHFTDFNFNVNYADLEHLSESEISYLGSLNLTTIKVTNVADVLAENVVDENTESKGIKAHFVMDDSGLFDMSGIELVQEKIVVEVEDESPLSKLGSTISKLFSSDKEEPAATVADDKSSEEQQPPASDSTTDEPNTADQADGSTTNKTEESVKNNATESDTPLPAAANKTEEKPKVLTVKKPIPNTVDLLFALPLDGDQLVEARKKIDDLNELERETVRRETALNALESYVIEANQKLEETEYSNCATEAEAEAVRKACAEVSDWLYEDGEGADAQTYEKRLKELKKLTNEIYARHWEHNERPEALKTLKSLIGSAKEFQNNAKNFTKEVNPEKDVYTPIELETLEKTISETEEWLTAELEAQSKLERYDAVRLTVKSLTEKMALIDREVKYLVNKLKIWKPKIKNTPKKEKKSSKNSTTTTEDTKKTSTEKLDEPIRISDDEKPVYEDQEDFNQDAEGFVAAEEDEQVIKPVTPTIDQEVQVEEIDASETNDDAENHSEL